MTKRIKEFLSNSSLKRKFHKLRIISAILNGKNTPVIGPLTAQIDITNKCNNRCIACWARSPMLEELEASEEWKDYELSFDKIKGLLDSLNKLRVKKIFFSGGGEPFMHPDIIEILRYSKNKGFEIEISTNFTMVTKEVVEKLMSLVINQMNVSMWAGTPETYTKVHPGRTKEDFDNVINNLKYLNETKKCGKPQINIVNVITNLNFDNLHEMVRLGFETHSELMDLVLVDTIKGKTDKLLLNEKQLRFLSEQLKNLPEMLTRWEKEYDWRLNIPLFEQLITKVQHPDVSQGIYYKNLIESIPCYSGWLFTRVVANGNVDPCLKAHRIPVGNVYCNSFKDIWVSKKYEEFRNKTNNFKKTDPYFTNIGEDPNKSGCYTSCDNFNENLNLFNDISKLKGWQKKLIKLIF